MELIDKQSAIDAINSWRCEYPYGMHELIDDCENSIEELPKVEIVRCSVCDFWSGGRCLLNIIHDNAYAFCSFGKRRENG